MLQRGNECKSRNDSREFSHFAFLGFPLKACGNDSRGTCGNDSRGTCGNDSILNPKSQIKNQKVLYCFVLFNLDYRFNFNYII